MSIIKYLLPIDERYALLSPKGIPKYFSRIVASGFPVNKLFTKKVMLIGAGGLGCVVAEILARTGLGELIIIDKDLVREENLNRLGFDERDLNKPKAEALKHKIEKIRNIEGMDEKYRIKIEAYHGDVIEMDEFYELIKKVDLVITAVDNKPTRKFVNRYAVEYNKIMVDGATSDDGFAGYVFVVIPGKGPCYECFFGSSIEIEEAPPIVGSCDASLATTMTIIGALMADRAMKILIGMREIPILTYVSLYGGLEISNLNPPRNPNCRVCSQIGSRH